MTKTILGKTLRGKKVVSKTGLELGYVIDAYFEDKGKLNAFIVQPERETDKIKEQLDKNGMLLIPYANVKAIGNYVVVDF